MLVLRHRRQHLPGAERFCSRSPIGIAMVSTTSIHHYGTILPYLRLFARFRLLILIAAWSLLFLRFSIAFLRFRFCMTLAVTADSFIIS
jgi:hypothetical protein